MKTFGFSMAEPNDPPNFYVAADNVEDDTVLFDWLTADNFKETDERGALDVIAPEGYIFKEDILVPLSECTDDEIKSVEDEDSDFWLDSCVSATYRDSEKADILIRGVMKYVPAAEFYALGIPENRTLFFTVT